jgi:hypothetical protein
MYTFTRQTQLLSLLFILVNFHFPLRAYTQNFPPITFTIEDSSATVGYYFISPYSNGPSFIFERPQLILDKVGNIVYYRVFPVSSNQTPTIDFKLQPDGRMSYFDILMGKFYLMDSTFMVVDSIGCTNGFETDQHDMQILPDHHYLLFGSETRFMNLTAYHYFGISHNQPGSANAEVTGVVIQEFDENKELVWEWKSHDHYQFSDVDPVWLFNPGKVDWTHANAVELDADGNILLSLRHFNEITKIDHSNGNILWRLGGKMNQFTFPNDPVRFTGQHDIRRVSETSISLFDNGQYTNPPVARGIEYSLDETNKIATLVWEYIYDSTMYSIACGNHQYIENGNHLVDFGFTNGNGLPWMVVVKPDKSKVLEVSMPNAFISYRAFNYTTLPWQLHRPNVGCEKTGEKYYLVAEPGYSGYRWSTGDTTSSIQIEGTGDYWVFVPFGAGYLSSERISITDTANPCSYTGEADHIFSDEISLECIPNPATDQVRIIFNLQEKSDVIVSLITIQGKELQRSLLRNCSGGNHETIMNVSSLDSGIYILSMIAGNTRIIKRIIIQ